RREAPDNVGAPGALGVNHNLIPAGVVARPRRGAVGDAQREAIFALQRARAGLVNKGYFAFRNGQFVQAFQVEPGKSAVAFDHIARVHGHALLLDDAQQAVGGQLQLHVDLLQAVGQFGLVGGDLPGLGHGRNQAMREIDQHLEGRTVGQRLAGFKDDLMAGGEGENCGRIGRPEGGRAQRCGVRRKRQVDRHAAGRHIQT
ncbi:hypothetical protein RZS08_11970, partial [Arthrospira platensis SPKY1]|nr:hypothetical protein [Arthrospira platensis SPKY1]